MPHHDHAVDSSGYSLKNTGDYGMAKYASDRSVQSVINPTGPGPLFDMMAEYEPMGGQYRVQSPAYHDRHAKAVSSNHLQGRVPFQSQFANPEISDSPGRFETMPDYLPKDSLFH